MKKQHPRQTAIATGATHYMTGKSCIRGHYARRNTNSGQCSACERQRTSDWQKSERGKAYRKELRATDHIKAYQRAYHQARHARIMAAKRAAKESK